MDGLNREVFDDDCRRFYAVNLTVSEGINGGEDDIRGGGRPTNAEKDSSDWEKRWRDDIKEEISRQILICPQTNYYREKNRIFQYDY
ncbi:hypothetical protein ACHAW5_004676 [Stephanodiscus triporus]|uniref:Uncharacterized protein n=1 Tax=Stephanodiscus triporus TaxID=2934178 RepID=A0ABD3QAB9_9STRA